MTDDALERQNYKDTTELTKLEEENLDELMKYFNDKWESVMKYSYATNRRETYEFLRGLRQSIYEEQYWWRTMSKEKYGGSFYFGILLTVLYGLVSGYYSIILFWGLFLVTLSIYFQKEYDDIHKSKEKEKWKNQYG